MPLRVDLFGNGIFYELWSWIDHIGDSTRHGHYIGVTRQPYPTSQWPPEFHAFDDGKDSKIVLFEDDKPVSKQAALVIYVRGDVAKQVCGTPTAIQFQDHIQKTYLFVRQSMVLVTCLMRSKKF
jgi:hypothetical protein